MKRAIYILAVIVTALGLFLPVLYGNVHFLRNLLGKDPLPASVLITVIGWAIAYLTFEED
jgi:hypothetical protein